MEGPLSLSIYTGTRKILSIFISIFWFNKTITLLQKISLGIGVLVMAIELLDKKKGGAKDEEKDSQVVNLSSSSKQFSFDDDNWRERGTSNERSSKLNKSESFNSNDSYFNQEFNEEKKEKERIEEKSEENDEKERKSSSSVKKKKKMD